MVVAATGFFDGVHAGHRAVLQVLKDTAREEGEESAVVTFWPHPRNVLQQDASTFRLLNTLDEKRELIYRFGIDHVHVVPFTRDFSQLSTTEFMKEYLVLLSLVMTTGSGARPLRPERNWQPLPHLWGLRPAS